MPFFRTSDVGKIRFGEIADSADHLTESAAQGLRLVPKGTILFPKSGASTFLDHRVLLAVDGYVSSHLATITADVTRVDPRFLLYYLATVHARELIPGQSYPSLNLPVISGIKVPLPNLLEQQRIVAILDESSEAIATACERAKIGASLVRELYDAELSELFCSLAKEWPCRPIGTMAELRNGINYTKGSRGETLPIVGVKDFKDNFYAPIESLDVATVDGTLSDDSLLRDGDILVVRSNGNLELIGRSVVVTGVNARVSHSGFTIRVRFDSSQVVTDYACRFLKSGATRRRLVEGGTGTNIKSLSQGMLATLEMPLPPSSVQAQVSDRLAELDEAISRLLSTYRHKLDSLDALRQSLLYEAFSGNL